MPRTTDDRLTVARVRFLGPFIGACLCGLPQCDSCRADEDLKKRDMHDLIIAQSDLLRRMGEQLQYDGICGCHDCKAKRGLLAERDKLEGATNDEGGE